MKKLLLSSIALIISASLTGCGSSQKEVKIDMFTKCNVEFEGLDGNGNVKEIKCETEIDGEANDSQQQLINELKVEDGSASDLKNGDKFDLYLQIDEQKEKELKDAGITLSTTKKEVEVKGLVSLYANANEFKSDTINTLDELMNDYLKNNKEKINSEFKDSDAKEYNVENFKLESRLFFKEEKKDNENKTIVKSNKVVYIYSFNSKTFKEPGFTKNDAIWFDRTSYLYVFVEDYKNNNIIDSEIKRVKLFDITHNFNESITVDELEEYVYKDLNKSMYNIITYQKEKIILEDLN